MTRKKIAFLLTIIILLAIVSGCCNPPKLSSVSVRLIPQHRDWWCWAATTEMISQYYGHRVDQCESANFVHGTPPDCCTGCTGDCPCWGRDWGATITDVQNNWSHWDFDYTYSSTHLSWNDLKETISTSCCCGKSPIQAVWWWWNGSGHVVTIYGYVEVGSDHYVAYYNPLPEDCQKVSNNCSAKSGGEDVVTTYAAFVSSGGRNWDDCFYLFKYTGP